MGLLIPRDICICYRTISYRDLMATQLPLDTQWCVQVGATPRTANVVLDFLHIPFGPCVISLRYPDHTISGIFGHLSAQTWTHATSFYGVSWKRSYFRGNLLLSWNWEQWWYSRPTRSKKTCVPVSSQTSVLDFMKLLHKLDVYWTRVIMRKLSKHLKGRSILSVTYSQ